MTNPESPRKYTNPPILEAIVGVEFDVLAEDPLGAVKAFAKTLVPDYPQQIPTRVNTAQIDFGAQVVASSHEAETGVASISADGCSVLELTIQNLTFKRLAPYNSWPEFSTHAREVWERLITHLEIQPRMVGLRYINRINIPANTPMEEFIKTYPEISRDLPQLMSQYFMRIKIPLIEIDALAIIQQDFTPTLVQGEYAVLLDIDIRLPVASYECLGVSRSRPNRKESSF